MDYASIMSATLRRPGRAPEPSVMTRPAEPEWQPEYVREPPLESVNPEDWVPNPKTVVAALKGAPALLGGIKTLYHGSARKFDKFDPARILSGEGNVSYGHGLYAAEHPDVGKHYAMVAAEANKARQFDLRNEIATNLAALRNPGYRGRETLTPENRANMLRRNSELQSQLSADPLDRYLYTLGVDDELLSRMFDLDANDNLSKYRQMVQKLRGHEAASNYLRNEGFTGTKYLDETSRKLGKGTSNFVLFDPTVADIINVKKLK